MAVWMSDTFDEASNTDIDDATHSPETGGQWIYLQGSGNNALIIGATNTLRILSSTVRVYSNTTPTSADYDVDWTYDYDNHGGTSTSGPSGRMSIVADSHYHVRYGQSADTFELFEASSGSYTSLGSVTASLTQPETGVLTLRMDGDQISVRDNDIEVIAPVTDSTHTAAGFCGFRGIQRNFECSLFEAQDLPAGGGAVSGFFLPLLGVGD